MPAPRSTSSDCICFAGGGSGGHILPGRVLARELQHTQQRVIWIGSQGKIEQQLLGGELFPWYALPARRWVGQPWYRRAVSLLLLTFAILRAVQILRRERAVLIVATGGFAAFPAAVGAVLLHRPLILLEQNARSGLLTKIFAPFARYIFTAYPNTLRDQKVICCSGNPMDVEWRQSLPAQKRYDLREGVLRVAVLGGSQGSQILNHTLPQALQQLVSSLYKRLKIRHQCGDAHLVDTRRRYVDCAVPVQVQGFWKQAYDLYSWADVIICRAGAMTISEICAVGVASLLIPLPNAARDHQRYNADFLIRAHAAWLCPQQNFTAEWLAAWLTALLNLPYRDARDLLMTLGARAQMLTRHDASIQIVQKITALKSQQTHS